MNQELRRKLNHIINTLVRSGLSNRVTYIEQLSYLIYLKLLDEEEAKREASLIKGQPATRLFPKQAGRYRWSKWHLKRAPDLRDFVRDEVFPYMASLVKEQPNVAEYFRDALLEITDPHLLKQIVDEIEGIQFGKLGPDVKGDIFEYLLSHLGEAGRNGNIRTPRQIRRMMVEMLEPEVGETILDPAAGTGGLLIDAVGHILAKYSSQPQEVPIYGEAWLEQRGQTLAEAKADFPTLQSYRKGAGDQLPDWDLLQRSIYGFDVSRQMVRIGIMNLILHGISNPQLKRANTLLALGGLSEEELQRQYNVILSSPSFGTNAPQRDIRRDLPTTSRGDLLFLALMMQSLLPGGRCAVIVRSGLLFRSTRADLALRKELVEDYDLQAIVSLPAGILPYTGIKTDVLVFRRPLSPPKKNAKASTKIWFYEVRADGYDLDNRWWRGGGKSPEHNDIPDLLQQWQLYKRSGFKKPPGIEARTLLDAGTKEPHCWWVTAKMVAEHDYNLAASHYKPQIRPKSLDEEPSELIREVLALEREIYEGLEALLREVEAVG